MNSRPASVDRGARTRKAREQAYKLRHGKPLHPVDHRPRSAIPLSGWRPEPFLAELLRKLDSTYELIHDPLTHWPGEPPTAGVHLYSRDRKNGDLLLERSCQWRMEENWPEGLPRPPGMWLIEYLTPRQKKHRPGDEALIMSNLLDDMQAVNEAAEEAQNKKDAETAQELGEIKYSYSTRFMSVVVPGVKPDKKKRKAS